MLPKKFRLGQKKDFDKVRKFGRFFGQDFLAIKIIKNNQKISRFGFLVGLKISKKAVVRNKVKRRLRESVRLKLKEIKPGFDAVILVRPEIIKKDYWEIDETINKVLKKANLFKKNNKIITPSAKRTVLYLKSDKGLPLTRYQFIMK